MLRVTECDKKGKAFGFEVFDIQTSNEITEAIENFGDADLLWIIETPTDMAKLSAAMADRTNTLWVTNACERS